MLHTHFFTELGHALYALAYADGDIQDSEVKELEHRINKIMQLLPADDIDSQLIILTRLRFMNCIDNAVKPADAMHSFSEFMKKNRNHIKDEYISTARILFIEVASAYKGINKSENQVLNSVEKLLL